MEGPTGAAFEMLASGERPRELHWYHAGAMLFGDWGASWLYVLGLAFAFTGGPSFWFVSAMCVLMISVGSSDEIICPPFPGTILDMAVTRGADVLLLRITRRGTLLEDYVIQAVAEHSPQPADLLIHA